MLYRFESFELDTDLQELRSSGEVRDLEPQVFDILRYLVENHDHLISRDELVSSVWNGRIVSDSAIDARIHAARKAVNDDGRKQARIRTVPRRGYRFIPHVEICNEGQPSGIGGKVTIQNFRDLFANRPSIAVLPFADQSRDRQQAYFADGFTDEIIAALSKFRWFVVAAGSQSEAGKEREIDVENAGRELGVRYLLRGGIRRDESDLRISIRLIDVEANMVVWAGHFDRRLQELFDLQDEIAATVARAIEPEIAVAERMKARRKPTESLDAWDHCQRGHWYFWRFSEKNFAQAHEHFQAAIKIDPNLGAAHTGQALVLTSRFVHGWPDGEGDLLPRAESAAGRAISLDQYDAQAHALLGRICTLQGQFDTAISRLQTALELNPNLTYALFGMGTVLFTAGRAREAIGFLEHGIRQSPRDPARWTYELNIGFCHCRLGETDEALERFNKALQYRSGSFWPYLGLAMTHAMAGHIRLAESAVVEALRIEPGLTLRQMAPILDGAEDLPSVELLRRSGLPEG